MNEAVVDHQEMTSKIRHRLGELVNQSVCKYKFVRKLQPVEFKGVLQACSTIQIGTSVLCNFKRP
jgi:hypothetical protein